MFDLVKQVENLSANDIAIVIAVASVVLAAVAFAAAYGVARRSEKQGEGKFNEDFARMVKKHDSVTRMPGLLSDR